MTPLEYLATNPSYDDAKGKFLLFAPELRAALLAKQDTLDTHNKIDPVLLSDGRYGSCCAMLTEIGEGGVYHDIWELLDKAALNTAELVDKSEFMALLPTEEI